MKVYHGSYVSIENIDFSYSHKSRDFGKGFYVTKFREQAELWAERKASEKDMEAIVTEFNFDEDFFEDEFLNILRFEDYSGDWLDFIVLNRKNRKNTQAHNYDIVEGPIADDDITKRVNKYLKGEITKEQFLIDLIYNPSHQICFCTMQSLRALEPNDKYRIDSKIQDVDNEIVKSLMTNYGLNEIEAADKYYTSQTYAKIADETIVFYQKQWQEIYEILKNELNMRD